MSLATLAIISGLLQAFGYFIYVRKSLRHEVEPNPTTWFMFAYGTVILTVLELDLKANWTLLVLPAVCAVLSVTVAFICWKRGTLKWPSHWIDRSAFVVDTLLTVAYLGVWFAASRDLVTEDEKHLLVIAFLVFTNASTIAEFVPLMKGAYENPQSEHPLPWFIWSTAYGTLACLTFFDSGWNTEFMIYPAMNTVLHGAIALLATRRWRRAPAPLTH